MIRLIFALLATVLFSSSASAQSCNRIVNPQTGEVLKIECFAPDGRLYQNGTVLAGGQQFVINNGQVTGCASQLQISFGGRDARLTFATCLAQAQQSGAIRTVYAGQQQGQTGGTTIVNNGTINVNTDGAATSGAGTANTNQPTVSNGNTCFLTTADGRLLHDFFSTDPRRNPLGRTVDNVDGAECDRVKRRYGMR